MEELCEKSVRQGGLWRSWGWGLTGTGQQRSVGVVRGRRLGAEVGENGRHVALGDAELAVLHHEVCELAHDGVVAVVFVGIAGQGQGGQAELVAGGSDGDGRGRDSDVLGVEVVGGDQGVVKRVGIVGMQLLQAAGQSGKGARLRGLGVRGACLDAVLEHLGSVFLRRLVFLEQLQHVSLTRPSCFCTLGKPTSCTGVPCSRSGPCPPWIFAILATSSLMCSCWFVLGPAPPLCFGSVA